MVMTINMIVAVDEKGGIGKNNTLPWHLPDDLKRFAKLTKGNGNNAIIMGRKTYESIGKPLPGRVNIVMSQTITPHTMDDDTNTITDNTSNSTSNSNSISTSNSISKFYVFPSKDDVIEFCKKQNFDMIWVIGGSSIYKEFINDITELYLTEIHSDFKCDTFFVEDYKKRFQQQCNVEDTLLNKDKITYCFKILSH